jgi:glycosyltransferase involved in cell wall biosynthesis
VVTSDFLWLLDRTETGETMQRLRVLLIAEAANPKWVSVPLVGWNAAAALREAADVHIITQVRNRDAFLRKGLVEGADFTAIDSEAIAAPFYRIAERLRGGAGKGWTTLTAIQSLTYPYFEHLVWKQFGKAITSGAYDIVHRVTPLSPTSPSSLAKKCRRANVPFILGPLNGGLPWPKGFNDARAKEKEWLSFIRSVYSLNPAIRSTYRNASAIIVGSRHTQSEVDGYGAPTVYIPENGIDPQSFPSVCKAPLVDRKLKAIFVGRLVPYKGADVAIEACAEAMHEERLEIEIVGDGPEMEGLTRLAQDLGVDPWVTFSGWLPHNEVPSRLAAADILVFPSIREFGGGVVLEAMACGTVPIVVNYGGPGELVTDETGFRIALDDKSGLILATKQIVDQLVDTPNGLTKYAVAARQRVMRLYTWAEKAKQIQKVYLNARSRNRSDLDFAFDR